MDQQEYVKFCGDPKAFGDQFPYFIYISIILFSLLIVLPVSIAWYKKRNFFPLKQRSTGLTFFIIINFLLLMTTYPTLVLLTWIRADYILTFSNDLRIMRALILTEEAFAFIIYILRSCRIIYAHNVLNQKKKSIVFRFFKKESNFFILAAVIMLFKLVPPMVQPFAFISPLDNAKFMELVSPTIYGSVRNNLFYMREMAFLIYLNLCCTVVYFQKNISPEYGINYQLVPLLSIAFSVQILKLVFYGLYGNAWVCSQDNRWAYGMLVQMFQGFLTLLISLFIPLYSARINHKVLPCEMITNDERDVFGAFLSQRLSLQIFYDFLKTKKQVEGKSVDYSALLRFWMRVTRHKLTGQLDLMSVNEDQEYSLKLLYSLQSIDSLTPLTLSSKVMDDLFSIFREEYMRTVSYIELRMILMRNSIITKNMVLMRLSQIQRIRSSSFDNKIQN